MWDIEPPAYPPMSEGAFPCTAAAALWPASLSVAGAHGRLSETTWGNLIVALG